MLDIFYITYHKISDIYLYIFIYLIKKYSYQYSRRNLINTMDQLIILNRKTTTLTMY